MNDKEKREKLDEIFKDIHFCRNKNLSTFNGTTQLVDLDLGLASYRLREFQRCTDDIEYFVSEYVNFDLYGEQICMVKLCQQFKHIGICLDEGKGTSLGLVIYLLHEACFRTHKKIGYMSQTYSDSVRFIGVFKQLFEALPKWLKPSVVKWHMNNVILYNGFSIVGDGIKCDGCHSYALNTLIMEDIDRVSEHNFQEAMNGIYPIVLSTKDHRFIYTYSHESMNNSDFISEGYNLHDNNCIIYKGV